MCQHGETQVKWKLKKRSNSYRLTSDDEAIYSAACCAQSNDGQIYIEVGKLKGRPVKVLLHTGCTGMKTDKIHPLKVKEAMSSVDKSTIEDLQKKDSTLKKCFNRIGKPSIRENYVGEFFMKKKLLYRKPRDEDGTKFKPVSDS